MRLFEYSISSTGTIVNQANGSVHSMTKYNGQNAPRSPLVKASQRKGSLPQLLEDNRRDQVAANDKEDVDANEPTTKGDEAGMNRMTGNTASALSPSISRLYSIQPARSEVPM